MNSLDLILLVFAAWRVSFMLVNESGPFKVFEWLRDQRHLTLLLDCLRCTSVWVSGALVAVYCVSFLPSVHFVYAVMVWLAVAGGVCFIDNAFYSLEATDG